MNKIDLPIMQNELNRVNEFIRFADKKIAFIFLIYSALFTFWITKADKLLDELLLINISFFGAAAFSLILGGFFIIRAVLPRLNNKTASSKSLFFFGHIAAMRFSDFSKKFQNLTLPEAKKQILEQIYSNSDIANEKMKNVQRCIITLAILILLTILYMIKVWIDKIQIT